MKTVLILLGMVVIGFRFLPPRPMPVKTAIENYYNDAIAYSNGTTGFAIGLALLGAGVFLYMRGK